MSKEKNDVAEPKGQVTISQAIAEQFNKLEAQPIRTDKLTEIPEMNLVGIVSITELPETVPAILKDPKTGNPLHGIVLSLKGIGTDTSRFDIQTTTAEDVKEHLNKAGIKLTEVNGAYVLPACRYSQKGYSRTIKAL